MRPWFSSCSRIVGMLRSTLIFCRFDQKPSSIVTARTGTECKFAYGEFVRFSTPWSCQGKFVPSTARPTPNAYDIPGRARYEVAAAAAVVAMNFRRVTFRVDFMDWYLPRKCNFANI